MPFYQRQVPVIGEGASDALRNAHVPSQGRGTRPLLAAVRGEGAAGGAALLQAGGLLDDRDRPAQSSGPHLGIRGPRAAAHCTATLVVRPRLAGRLPAAGLAAGG